MKKVLAILLVCALAVSMCLVMAGCGDDKKSDTNATQAASTAPTSAAATKAASGTQSGGSTQAPGTYSNASGYQVTDVWYAGISENDAGNAAFNTLPEAGYITAMYPGYYTDGTQCWTIEVTGNSGSKYVCYVAKDYSSYIVLEDASNNYAGLTMDEAINGALAEVTGSTYESCCCGYYYNGDPCWMISVVDPYGVYYLVYVSSNFIIPISYGPSDMSYPYQDDTNNVNNDDNNDDNNNNDSSDDVYAGLTREAAMANAQAAVGDGATCYSAYQGALSNGNAAWFASVESADGNWVTVVLDGNGIIAMG